MLADRKAGYCDFDQEIVPAILDVPWNELEIYCKYLRGSSNEPKSLIGRSLNCLLAVQPNTVSQAGLAGKNPPGA